MVAVWARLVEKAYNVSKEAGEAKLAEVPECYYDAVVAKLIKDKVIAEAPVKAQA